MQTYWDGATNRWVTRQADGTVRAATNAEALLAYSNGAQAPVGSRGPSPDPYPLQRNQQSSVVVGGITYTWDTKTGKYVDPAGHTTEDNNAPQSPPSAPAPAPAP